MYSFYLQFHEVNEATYLYFVALYLIFENKTCDYIYYILLSYILINLIIWFV